LHEYYILTIYTIELYIFNYTYNAYTVKYFLLNEDILMGTNLILKLLYDSFCNIYNEVCPRAYVCVHTEK